MQRSLQRSGEGQLISADLTRFKCELGIPHPDNWQVLYLDLLMPQIVFHFPANLIATNTWAIFLVFQVDCRRYAKGKRAALDRK